MVVPSLEITVYSDTLARWPDITLLISNFLDFRCFALARRIKKTWNKSKSNFLIEHIPRPVVLGGERSVRCNSSRRTNVEFSYWVRGRWISLAPIWAWYGRHWPLPPY
eukprot:g70334.t1